jgi:hypothetical protein
VLTALLAPHHDDLLLSLPRQLLDPAPGERHLVVCFSDEDPALERVCAGLHAELGLPVHTLGLPEARRRGEGLRAILRPRRLLDDVSADPLLGDLARALGDLLRRLDADEAWAPLLPVHLDHALVRAAAERLAALPLAYYEDQPYAALFDDRVQRERAGLVPHHRGPAADAGRVERLLRPLEAFLSTRDLERLLQRQSPEVVWRLTGPRSSS